MRRSSPGGRLCRLGLQPGRCSVFVLCGPDRVRPHAAAVCSCYLAPPSRRCCGAPLSTPGAGAGSEPEPAAGDLVCEPHDVPPWIVHLLPPPDDANFTTKEAAWLAQLGFPGLVPESVQPCTAGWAALLSEWFSVRGSALRTQEGCLRWRLVVATRPRPLVIMLSWLVVMDLLTLLDRSWLAVHRRTSALPLGLGRFELLAFAVLHHHEYPWIRAGPLCDACRTLVEQTLRYFPRRALACLAAGTNGGRVDLHGLHFPVCVPPSVHSRGPSLGEPVAHLLRKLALTSAQNVLHLDTLASGSITSAWVADQAAGRRSRDRFPLPGCMRSFIYHERPDWSAGFLDLVADVVDSLILSLNVMFGFATTTIRAQVLGVHRDVHLRLAGAVFRAGNQLSLAEFPTDADGALADLTNAPDSTRKAVRLHVADCDVFARCGQVHPLPSMRDEDRAVIADVRQLFPAYHPGLKSFSTVAARDRPGYVSFVVKQLRCGKVVLRSACTAGGTIFPIQKSSGKQRVIWHGEALSEATRQAWPPRPLCFGWRRLRASPSGSPSRTVRPCLTNLASRPTLWITSPGRQ